MKTKVCTRCKRVLPLSNFGKHSITKDGLNHRCKECNRKRHEEYYKTASGIYTILKSRSKFFKKTKVKITRQEFTKWFEEQPKNCIYCDVPEELINEIGDAWNNRMKRLQIDRIDNNLDYIQGNMVLACPRCNMIKSDYFTFEEMREIGQKYIKPRWITALG